MDRIGKELGRKVYKIPCGGSNALGTLGYIDGMREVSDSGVHFDHLVCTCGSAELQRGVYWARNSIFQKRKSCVPLLI